ncbi:hypothetical protein KIH74_18030 [Kineosporia sp. J2-2]|uniref:HEAT repeat protein n=1 Tax=Kineosporia corallincola TaxID=2835133 RepID=A0ABS5TIE7_9ACTN|nr:hypothetical protein [Kineosporia corallincola]MBT0770847.1 hypothetical protein [Kineosporia corallincola]
MFNRLEAAAEWSSLTHAHGEADDTPGLLAQMWHDDWADAVDELFASVLAGDAVYPATVAALPFLVDVALDGSAPGRFGALQLLGGYGEALAAGSCPGFLAGEALAGLGDSVLALLPLAADPDPDVRIALYRCAVSWGPWPQVADVLRERLAAEDDPQARLALMRPLARLRLLTAADLENRPDDVVFAVAWSAVTDGPELPGAVDHLVRLWLSRAAGHPVGDDPLGALVRSAGVRAVPVLERLAGVVAAVELAWGWHDVARLSRSAAGPALEAVLGLADGIERVDVESFVGALLPLLPLAGPRAAEPLVGLLRRTRPAADGQAACAVALFAVRDPRWVEPALAATVSGQAPWVEVGGNPLEFAEALGEFGAGPGVWDEPGLATVALAAIAARAEAAGTWTALLVGLPASALPVGSVRTLLGLPDPHPGQPGPDRPADPVAPSRPAMRLLARLARDRRELFDDAARRAISSLPVSAGDTGAWLLVTQALLSGGDPAAFTRAWRISESGPGEDELLRIWAAHPSEELDRVCLDLITRTTWAPYRSRAVQVAAAEILLGAGGTPEELWPALLTLLPVAGAALPGVIRLGHRLVTVRPELRDEWVAALGDFADDVPQALEALQTLGAIAPEPAVRRAVAGLTGPTGLAGTRRAAEAVPVVARVIRNALAEQPHLRPEVTRALAPLIAVDERVLLPGEVSGDTVLTRALRAGVRS